MFCHFLPGCRWKYLKLVFWQTADEVSLMMTLSESWRGQVWERSALAELKGSEHMDNWLTHKFTLISHWNPHDRFYKLLMIPLETWQGIHNSLTKKNVGVVSWDMLLLWIEYLPRLGWEESVSCEILDPPQRLFFWSPWFTYVDPPITDKPFYCND